jgi:charged multivesicular body protein 1
MGNKQEPQPPQKSPSDQLFETIFEFKMQAKELSKQSKKLEKERDQMYERVKKAIADNKPEAAKLYATDAIRKRNEAVKYEILSYKLEAVHSKLKSAYQTTKLNENMSKSVISMQNALGTMDLVKISENMNSFEKMFDDLDANAQLMDKAMDNIDAGSYAERDVSNLIMQVAQMNSIQVSKEFDDIVQNSDPKVVNEMISKEKSLNKGLA